MWFKNKPIFALAPMADYINQPFSLLCREISGKNFVIFREMVSAEAIIRENEKTLRMCTVNKRESPVVIQIFGDNPSSMAKAARIIFERFKPDGIDINMGCPVPKIAQKSRAGAALMKYPDLAEEIVRAIKSEKLKCPLSAKTRLGWVSENEILDFAPRLERAGIDLLTIHGRTKVQGYAGSANWDKIGDAIKLLSIPVIANGDIKNQSDCSRCLKITGAAGIMIGRGALGNPQVFQMSGAKLSINSLIKTILRHAELHLEYFGERGIVTFRKYLPWYFQGERISGIKEIKKIRKKLVRIDSMEELNSILSSL